MELGISDLKKKIKKFYIIYLYQIVNFKVSNKLIILTMTKKLI